MNQILKSESNIYKYKFHQNKLHQPSGECSLNFQVSQVQCKFLNYHLIRGFNESQVPRKLTGCPEGQFRPLALIFSDQELQFKTFALMLKTKPLLRLKGARSRYFRQFQH